MTGSERRHYGLLGTFQHGLGAYFQCFFPSWVHVSTQAHPILGVKYLTSLKPFPKALFPSPLTTSPPAAPAPSTPRPAHSPHGCLHGHGVKGLPQILPAHGLRVPLPMAMPHKGTAAAAAPWPQPQEQPGSPPVPPFLPVPSLLPPPLPPCLCLSPNERLPFSP